MNRTFPDFEFTPFNRGFIPNRFIKLAFNWINFFSNRSGWFTSIITRLFSIIWTACMIVFIRFTKTHGQIIREKSDNFGPAVTLKASLYHLYSHISYQQSICWNLCWYSPVIPSPWLYKRWRNSSRITEPTDVLKVEFGLSANLTLKKVIASDWIFRDWFIRDHITWENRWFFQIMHTQCKKFPKKSELRTGCPPIPDRLILSLCLRLLLKQWDEVGNNLFVLSWRQ